MAAPTTLLEAATQQRANADAAKKAAQPAVSQAQKNLKEARQGHEDATKAFAMLEQKVSEIRKQLATIPTPADGDALVEAFEQTLIKLRAQQLKVLVAEEAVEIAQAEVLRTNAAMQWATDDLTKAEAVLKEVEQQSKQREDLKKALAAPPLSTTHDEAVKALDTPPHNDLFVKARARIEQDMTAALMAHARERRDALEAVRLAQREAIASLAQTLLLNERDQHGGLAGTADKLRAGFQQTEDAFRDYIANAQQRYDMARTMLAKVADPHNDSLTAAQSKRIHDDSLKAKREVALTKEKGRDDKLQDVYSKQEALEEAQLQAVAKHSDPATDADVVAAQGELTAAETARDIAEKTWSEKEQLRNESWDTLQEKKKAYEEAVRKAKEQNRDPETDAAVVAAKTALSDAQKAFETAETAYRESDKGILHAWEAAVPDSTWRQLADFAEAERLLKGLKDTNAATLVSQMTDAEKAFAAAWLEADQSRRVLRSLEAELAEQTARRAVARKTAQRRLFSALRGDH